MRARRRGAHLAIYAILVAVTIIMLFPVAWMLTVSVRPNVEVMKIPPDWIPALFTLEAYNKVLRSGRYRQMVDLQTQGWEYTARLADRDA